MDNQKEFMSLLDFLMFRDPFNQRSIHGNIPLDCGYIKGIESKAQALVLVYEIAKISWNSYGNDGPENGAVVITLNSGYGSNALVNRIFNGINPKDQRLFLLEGRFLLNKDYWWAHVATKNCFEKGKENFQNIKDTK